MCQKPAVQSCAIDAKYPVVFVWPRRKALLVSAHNHAGKKGRDRAELKRKTKGSKEY